MIFACGEGIISAEMGFAKTFVLYYILIMMNRENSNMNDSMPPVKNRFLYMYRVFMKWTSYFVFGFGSLILATLLFPVMTIFIHPKEKFQKYTRRLISVSFRGFIKFMTFIQIVIFDPGDRDVFRSLKSRIIVANHPSHLDVVMLISLIPNADVIVRGDLAKNFVVREIIRRLYILNSIDFNSMVSACKKSLDQGNCIVIFPEGTRTPRSGLMRLKKGAARLSLLTGTAIVPVHIGGTDKYGLGKGDPWNAFNHTEKYIYSLRIQKQLNPEKYAGIEIPKAVRRLNAEINDILKYPENK